MRNQITAFLLLLATIEGFVIQSPVNSQFKTTTILSASTDENNECVSRRDLGVKTSSAILATAAMSLNSNAASAEGEQEGRLIEFIVENLDGEAGNTGRFVMKTNPGWAPNGVKR
jgi:hypothetical protein